MKQRLNFFKRQGVYYIEDTTTRKQRSLFIHATGKESAENGTKTSPLPD